MTAEERVAPLDQAREIITKDRNAAYGNPEDNFAAIAALWDVYLHLRFRNFLPVTAHLDTHDVALMMDLMKTGRILTGAPLVIDNYIDGIGYKAIAWEQALLKYAPAPEPEFKTAAELERDMKKKPTK